MMCIISIENGEVTGWLMGQDTYDLRRQVENLMMFGGNDKLQQLMNDLYVMEHPGPGKHQLSAGHVLLVS